jgi:transposase InsO family protein
MLLKTPLLIYGICGLGTYIGEKGLKTLAKEKLRPLGGISLKPCIHSLSGKQHRVAFHRKISSRRSNIRHLVHTDVCSMNALSLGGAEYYVSFLDSRKVWAFPLKSKDQVLDVFKYFHASVERETGRKRQCIRADNGGEYRGPFERYCREYGIRLEKTVPKRPQHNGVAERMNRTICERIRSMLSHAKLPKHFWAEAMRTAVDVINLSPSVPLGFDIPQRVWTGKDVSYDHLRVFGCRAFVHIPKDERSKLDGKSKQCIFLGYAREEFGYRLWDPVDKKIIRSRDVVFRQDQTIEDFEKEKPKSTPHTHRSHIDLGPSIPPMVEGETEAEMQEYVRDALDEPVESEEHAEQAPPASTSTSTEPPPPQQELRKSTCHPLDILLVSTS